MQSWEFMRRHTGSLHARRQTARSGRPPGRSAAQRLATMEVRLQRLPGWFGCTGEDCTSLGGGGLCEP